MKRYKLRNNHSFNFISLFIAISLLFLLPFKSSVANNQTEIIKKTAKNISGLEARKNHTANKLITEKSNYLLQHANNPIDWYPWGKEAFDKAKKENKPILLSIGYATCHWCHVMRRESFENSKIAAYLNEHFVSIKVDREQRPDIDKIYLTALQIFSGQGGWPITGFISPNAKPFLISSYLTADELMQQLEQVNQRWQLEQPSIEKMADELYGYVQEALQHDYQAVKIKPSLLSDLLKKTLQYQDKQWGGIKQTPKFSQTPLLTLLMKKARRSSSETALDNFIMTNLNGMLQGGLYDQLAGGFHRYTSDRAWRKPHYEKMLYDQAQFIALYQQAWLTYQVPEYQRIALETASFLLENMQDSNRCFYSAIDADSSDGSNDYYHWNNAEVISLLNKNELKLFNDTYGITDLMDETKQGPLYLKNNFNELSKAHHVNYDQFMKKINMLREKLRLAQKKRSAPKTDKTQILQWNAMAISSLANLGHTFKESKYIHSAEKCAQSIWSDIANNKGETSRTILHKDNRLPALLTDHSQLVIATLTLYDVTKNQVWLSRAKQLYKTMIENYFDQETSAFFNTTNDNVNAVLRTQYVDDSIMPAGNSSALAAMVMLQQRAGNQQLNKKIMQLIAYFANRLNQSASSMGAMLTAIEEYKAPQAKQLMYAGLGNIRVSNKVINNREFDIIIDIKEGWHINSHQPIQKQLIATNLVVTDISSPNKVVDVTIQYPKGEIQNLGFSNEPMSLYSENVIIRIKYNDRLPLSADVVKLKLQACNNKLCLLPEKLGLKLFMPNKTSSN